MPELGEPDVGYFLNDLASFEFYDNDGGTDKYFFAVPFLDERKERCGLIVFLAFFCMVVELLK